MRIFLPILSLLLISPSAFGQGFKELAAGYYIVVAAYDNTRESYAEHYTKTLVDKGFTAAYGFNSSRNLFFVYLEKYLNLKDALNNMYALRRTSKFSDAWVRVVLGVISQPGELARPITIAEESTEAEAATVAALESTDKLVKQEAIQQKETAKAERIAEQKAIEIAKHSTAEIETVTTAPINVVEEIEEKIVQHYPTTLGNTDVFLSLFNATNNRIIDGDVMVIDTDRGRLIKIVKGNEYMTLPDPKNQSGKISLICDVFGYRKLQHEINFKNPEADTALAYFDMMGLSFVMTFDLVRYRKGDIQTLSHVYFYNDAAIMLPESRYEINVLLQMMNESPTMKIRLHGHTNGHYSGKIIKMGPEKNFFSIGKDAVDKMGSAKDLSYERAEIIKEYLMANNIAADRIVVKGWGGKKPLFDKHSANAKKNVRVEVEVVAE
jgi:outer membrane protein OmpA-like peptidoglycan-associated protein